MNRSIFTIFKHTKILSKAVWLSSHFIRSGSQQVNEVLSSTWDGRPFGHNRHGPKIGGTAPLWTWTWCVSESKSSNWRYRRRHLKLPLLSLRRRSNCRLKPANDHHEIISSSKIFHSFTTLFLKENLATPSLQLYILGAGWAWVPIWHSVTGTEAYLRNKFRRDPSNRLTTVHQRYRQTGQTDRLDKQIGQWSDSIGQTVL